MLLAVENAPPGKRAWYGMFPQLGAPLGFILSGGVFLLLSRLFTDEQFFAFGWRIPFLASAVLVIWALRAPDDHRDAGVSARPPKRHERVKVPMLTVFRDHPRPLGSRHPDFAVSVRALLLHDGVCAVVGHVDARLFAQQFLIMQLFAILFFALTIPIAAVIADAAAARRAIWVNVGDCRLRRRHGAAVRRPARSARCRC